MFGKFYSHRHTGKLRYFLKTALVSILMVNSSYYSIASAKTPNEDSDRNWTEAPNGGDMPKFVFKDSASLKENSTKEKSEIKSDTEAFENSPDDQYFPGAAVKNEYSNKIKEIKKIEEQERQILLEREEYEKKKIEAMEKIEIYKRDIEDLKRKEHRLYDESELMKDEIAKVQGKQDQVQAQLKEISEKTKIENAMNEEVKSQLNSAEEKLRQTNTDLQKSRVQSEAKLSKVKIEIQQALAAISRDESIIARMESEKSDLQNKEIQAQSNYLLVANKKKELAEEKSRLLSELATLDKNYQNKQKEYLKLKAETDASNKEVAALASKVGKSREFMISETNKLESKILQSKDAIARNQYEKEKLASEIEKMNEQLASARKRYDETVAETDESNIAVMQSKTSLETSKSQLAIQLADTDKLKFNAKVKQNQIRNLASLAEASDMLDTQKKAKLLMGCKVRRGPSSTARVDGLLSQGTVIYAAPTDSGFYKVLNRSGRPQFVDGSCIQVVED